MRRSVLFLLTCVVATPLYGEPASLWTHNGSTVGLYANGPYRAFRYHAPRQGLRSQGVTSGTLLFEGARSADSYSGTAYVFSRRCGAVPYPVSGQPAADDRSLVLFGVAPAGFNSACQATHFRNDVLRFDLKKVLIPPAPPPAAPIAAAPQFESPSTYTTLPTPTREVPRVPEAPTRTVVSFDAPARPDAFLRPIVWLLGCLMALGLVSYIASSASPLHASPPADRDGHRNHPSTPHAPSDQTQPNPPFVSRIAMTLDATDKPDQGSALVPTPDTAYYDKIVLKLRRSQRAGALGGKPVFILDVRVDVPSEDRNLIAKYRLGAEVVYDSKARKQHAEAAYAHFGEAQAGDLSLTSTARSLWKTSRGIASAAMMALSLRVTINKLLAGQHIECKDLDELLGAEAAVVEACKNLRAYLDTARTFDGREELHEF